MCALDGKTCLMTGATAGIGRAAASGLVAQGANLVIIARDAARCHEAVTSLTAAGPGRARGIIADLGSQRDVRRAAAEALASLDRIDVLILCAGVVARRRTLTVDGIETQLAVNHLAPFLLTTLLLERLRRSAPSRVITVASQVERGGYIDFEDLGRERAYDPIAAYCQTKLANVLFTLELAKRLAGSGVTANCLHPGVVRTKLLHDYVGRPRLLKFLTALRNPGPEEAGRHLVRLATAPDLAGVSGAYFHEGVRAEPSSRATDGSMAERLWKVSEALVSRSPA